ncbi:hypothetical protein [Candidatus Orientia mediorientalis]|uniref:hypothetical protein n=1 Tax=Candidatus Orientia mediorientalis TaxID=911112 RepID=UPI001E29860D|nr:hypothetical protein [Candidatus Orientia mediorientalis]
MEKVISEFIWASFNKKIKDVTYDEHCPRRIILEFDTQNSIHKNTVPQFVVRTSQLSDIEAMVSLSKAKRKLYEKAQPQFWRYAEKKAITHKEGGLQNCWKTKIM